MAADDNDSVTTSLKTLVEIQAQAGKEGEYIIKKLIELYAKMGITKTPDEIVREAFDQHNPEYMTQSQLEATYNAQLKLMLEKPLIIINTTSSTRVCPRMFAAVCLHVTACSPPRYLPC